MIRYVYVCMSCVTSVRLNYQSQTNLLMEYGFAGKKGYNISGSRIPHVNSNYFFYIHLDNNKNVCYLKRRVKQIVFDRYFKSFSSTQIAMCSLDVPAAKAFFYYTFSNATFLQKKKYKFHGKNAIYLLFCHIIFLTWWKKEKKVQIKIFTIFMNMHEFYCRCTTDVVQQSVNVFLQLDF